MALSLPDDINLKPGLLFPLVILVNGTKGEALISVISATDVRSPMLSTYAEFVAEG